MRMIDYDAVMKALEEEYQWQDHEKVAHEMLNVVKYFPTIEQPHWIPCSEKLPEDGVYLVTYESGYSESGVCDIEDVCCYDEDEGWEETHVIPNKKILAWTNLPEPYKESEEC